MNERSLRQSFLGANSDFIFRQAIVGITGLCGGGSHIAQQLAHVGFRRFRLFDSDYTDHRNLNRMIGSRPADASSKRPKPNVIADLIMSIQPEAEVELFPCRWQDAHTAMRDCTLAFGCVDSFSQRDELEAYCRRFLLPYIDIGMDVHERADVGYSISGQVITSLPGGPCMRCMGFITEEQLAREAEQYGAAGDRPQVIWPNGILASTAVGIAVSLLTPWMPAGEIVPFVEYDGNRHSLRASSVLGEIVQHPCRHYPTLEVGDPFWKPEVA